MSKQGMVIEERSRDIGDFLVGRLLPFRKKRMLGPFIFLDHMGPVKLKPGKGLDIAPHPHIGLSTLTYLFSGQIMHRDSLGSEQLITPGAVNWMTAGKGIAHSERTPKMQEFENNTMHGLQIWVALPKQFEDTEPAFSHTEKEQLPRWESNGIKYTLVAGEAYGHVSQVPVYSPLYMLDVMNTQSATLSIKEELKGEFGIYILEGSVHTCGETIQKGHLLIAKDDEDCSFTLGENSRCIVLGGEPLPEKRHIYWNFVHSSREKIEEAKERWRNKEFPKVPGDDGYIPLPGA